MRVYFEDTDAGGVVYHAQYLHFMERARTEWLRDLGFDQTRMAREQSLMFVAHEVQIKFMKPARLDDMLSVTAQIESVGRCRLRFAQNIVRGEEILARASVSIATVHAENLKLIELPADLCNLLIINNNLTRKEARER